VKRLALLTLAALVFFVGPLHASPDTPSAKIPDDQRDLAQRAADAFQKQDYATAAADYQKMLKAHPDSLYAWSNLGVARFQQGHLEEARAAFLTAHKLNASDVFTLTNLGIVSYQLNAFNDAIKALNAASVLNPNDANIHNYLGLAYEKAGRKAESLSELAKAKALENVTP